MNKSAIKSSRPSASRLSRRARFACGASLIAAIGMSPAVSHAADVNFAEMADAI